MLGPVDKPGVFGRVLLVSGPESLVAERAVAERVETALVERPDAAVVRVEASGLDAGSLAEVTGGSLFAASTVVVINDLAELPPELHEAVSSLATTPLDDVALVLVHAGGMKGKALLDRLRKARADGVDCPPIKPWELPQFAVNEARRHGGRLDGRTADILVEAVGTDTRAVAAAVRQLLDDADDRVITDGAVRRYFAGRADVTSFAVADDILSGRLDAALGKLRWALASGVAPVLVTSALSNSLRSLGKYLDAQDARTRDADLARAVGVPPWKLKELARHSRDWQVSGVSAAIQAVAIADAQIKGASSDAGFALEKMVLTVTRMRRQATGRR